MARKALQVRLDPGLHTKIGFFASASGTSMNRLVVDAVESYVQQLAVELDSELTDTLRRVRSYAQSEANEERDLADFVQAEVSLSGSDPAEGTVVSAPKAATPADQLGRILAGLG